MLQGASLRAARSSAFVCWPIKASTQIGNSAGEENLAIMADLSNSSDIMALDGLPEELLKKTLRPHCYRVTEQGVIMVKISVINELRMYDLPKHSKSTASAISGFLILWMIISIEIRV